MPSSESELLASESGIDMTSGLALTANSECLHTQQA